jgi:PST family polysaccharide transporter
LKSILRSTAILSSSSLVTILIGLVSAKAWAVMLGATGLGAMGLLQSLVGLTVMLLALGVGPGLVRLGASALAEDDAAQLAALRRAAWLLLWLPSGFAVIVLVLFRNEISRVVLDSPDHGRDVALMSLVVPVTMAAAIQASLLNAYHRVAVLAKIAVLTSALGTAAGLGVIYVWRERGVPAAIIATAAVTLAVTGYYYRREIGPSPVRTTWAPVVACANALIRFGVPYTGSMLVGMGIQLALPIFVVHRLGQTDVGYYRAAMAIAVSYLGFLTSAMAQDYFPRLSAVKNRPDELCALANQQFRLVLLIGAPLILGVLALSPFLVPIIYTPSFRPAVAVIEWQLIGDIFKFASWTMAYVVLVRSGSVAFFLIELTCGVATLLTSWLGLQWFGLAGMGIAFLVSYAVYFLVVWATLRRILGFSLGTENAILLTGALAAAGLMRLSSTIDAAEQRFVIGMVLAGAAGFVSLRLIWTEVGGLRAFRS